MYLPPYFRPHFGCTLLVKLLIIALSTAPAISTEGQTEKAYFGSHTIHATQLCKEEKLKLGETVCIITYGMGVHLAKNAASFFEGNVEVVDLRCLYPLDEETIFETVKKHGKVIVLSEEQQTNSFAESLSLRISNNCYHFLDAKVEVIGAMDLPATPINTTLEKIMLPTIGKLKDRIEKLIQY